MAVETETKRARNPSPKKFGAALESRTPHRKSIFRGNRRAYLRLARRTLRRNDGPTRRAIALSLVAMLHVALVGLLLFGLLLHTTPGSERLLEVSIGGPLGAQIKIAPATPVFVDPDTPQPITMPDDVAIETANALSGSPDVTRPAEAIADAHAFPASGDIIHRAAIVKLLLSISENGDVFDAQVVESSGASSLDSLAIAWVKQRWRYRPALRNGLAVAVTTTAIVKFVAGG